MGYRRLYEVFCDAPGCDAKDVVASAIALPDHEAALTDRNNVPEGWSKLKDTDSGELFTWCPRHAAHSAEEALLDTSCEVCGKPQRETPSGPVCENGHGGARGMVLPGGTPIEALFGPHAAEADALAQRLPCACGAPNRSPGPEHDEFCKRYVCDDAETFHPENAILTQPGESLLDTVSAAREACNHASQHRDARDRLVCSLCGRTWMGSAWEDVGQTFVAQSEHLTGGGAELETREAASQYVTHVDTEGDTVYALCSDGRILQKTYENEQCARVGAEQTLRIQTEPDKLLAWFGWTVAQETPEGQPHG